MQAQQQPSRFWFSHDWQAGAQELAAANDIRGLFNLVLKNLLRFPGFIAVSGH